MSESPDPWRAVVEITADADRVRAEHAELAARLEVAGSRFHSSGTGVAGLLDDVDRRAVVDVEAPVESSRPVVPQLKTSVRKAVAFVARHLAQQTTVLVGGLSAAVRLLDERVQHLERDGHQGAVDRAPDVRGRVELHLDWLAEQAGGTRRDVGTRAELHTLPHRDAALVVGYGIVDVGPVATRLAALDHLVAAVAPGGTLAIVSVDPGAWHHTADAVTRDLGAPGPLHPDTWGHLLHERGASDVHTHSADGAHVIAGRW